MDGDIAPLPGDRRGGRGVRRGRDGRRRPCVRRPGPERPRHASTISGSMAGSPSRSGRCPRPSGRSAATSRGRRPARDPDPARAAVPVLDVPPAGRRRRLPRGDPGDAGRARAPRAAVGEHPPLQGGADPPRLRHGRLGDADHAGDDGRPRHRRTVQRPALRGGRLRPAGRLPDRRHRQGADPDDRDRRPRATSSSTRRSRPSTRVGHELGLIAGDGTPGRPSDRSPAARPAARRAPPHGPVAGQRRPDRRLRGGRPSSAGSPRSPSPTTSTSSPARRPSASRTFERARADRPRGRRALGARGRGDPVRRRAHLRPRAGRTTSASTSPATRTTSPSARSTTGSIRRTASERVAALGRGPAAARRSSRRPSTRSRRRPAPGLFDADRPPRLREALSRTRTSPRPTSRRARALRADPAWRWSTPAPPSRSTPAACAILRARPIRRPAIVARSVELGGRAVTVGSDAHRSRTLRCGLAEGYAIAAARRFGDARVPAAWRPGRGRRARLGSGLPAPLGGPRAADHADAVMRGTPRQRRLDLDVLGAGPGLHGPSRVRPAPPTSSAQIGHRDPARSRPGLVPAAGRGDRAVHARRGPHQPPPPGPLHRPRAAAPLPSLRVPRRAPRPGLRAAAGLDGRLDALHAEPGFSPAALDLERAACRARSTSGR